MRTSGIWFHHHWSVSGFQPPSGRPPPAPVLGRARSPSADVLAGAMTPTFGRFMMALQTLIILILHPALLPGRGIPQEVHTGAANEQNALNEASHVYV